MWNEPKCKRWQVLILKHIVFAKHGSVCRVFFLSSCIFITFGTSELLVASCNDASVIYLSGQHKEYLTVVRSFTLISSCCMFKFIKALSISSSRSIAWWAVAEIFNASHLCHWRWSPKPTISFLGVSEAQHLTMTLAVLWKSMPGSPQASDQSRYHLLLQFWNNPSKDCLREGYTAPTCLIEFLQRWKLKCI